MAVDGKNASGRLAAATVLWLLVAIFANQDYVYCAGEEEQQQQQFQQQQLQQRLQQQQQPPTTQQQQSQLQPQPILPPQQQQQQQQQQQPQPQPQPQPQQPQPQPQPQQPPPPPQQQQQQQPSPPQQQQRPLTLGMLSQMANELQPNVNRLTGQSINPDLGPNPLLTPQQQQQQNNVAGPLNMPGGGRIPTFSSPSMPPMQVTSYPAMQAGGPPQVPNFDETNLSQGINPPFRVNMPSEYNPNLQSSQMNPSLGQSQYSPPTQANAQMNNAQGPSNNDQDPMNNLNNLPHRYPLQMPQKSMMPLPSQIQQFSPNHYLPTRPFMGQLNQRPYQAPYYFNGNAGNGNVYEVPNNTPSYPGQSFTNMNLGDFLQPAQILTNMVPAANPLELVLKPADMLFKAVGQLGKYSEGIKEGLSRAYKEGVGKILDQSQTGVQRVLNMSSTGTDAVIDFGRRVFIPGSQQTSDSGVRYNTPQPSMQPSMQPSYSFNSNQPSPNHMAYNTQPHRGAGSFVSGNGQLLPQGFVPQLNENAQQEQYYGMTNPVNNPQPIVRYGQT